MKTKHVKKNFIEIIIIIIIMVWRGSGNRRAKKGASLLRGLGVNLQSPDNDRRVGLFPGRSTQHQHRSFRHCLYGTRT